MMRNTRTLQVVNVKRNDVQNAPFNMNTPGFTMDMFKQYYSNLISQGYIIYDVYANNGFTGLSSKTPGKYLCVWSQSSTTTFALPSSVLLGSGGVAHTSIIITGAIVNKINSPISFVPVVNLGSISLTDSYEKLMISYCSIYITQSYQNIYNMSFYYSNISNANSLGLYYLVAGKMISNSVLTPASGPTSINNQGTSNLQIINSKWYTAPNGHGSSLSILGDGNGLTIKNSYIDNGDSDITIKTTGSLGINAQNVFIKTTAQISYTYNVILFVIGSTIYTVQGQLYYAITGQLICMFNIGTSNQQYIDTNGLYIFNNSILNNLSSSKYILDAKITQMKISTPGSLGTIRRQFYKIDFIENHQFNDDLKNFDDNDIFIVNRADLSAYLLTTLGIGSVLGLRFYQGSGSTLAAPRIDETFLIQIINGSNIHYIAWHQGELKKTIYSDYWDETRYTIGAIFQIWENPAEVDYSNLWNQTNSPISGSIQVQDITSKVIR